MARSPRVTAGEQLCPEIGESRARPKMKKRTWPSGKSPHSDGRDVGHRQLRTPGGAGPTGTQGPAARGASGRRPEGLARFCGSRRAHPGRLLSGPGPGGRWSLRRPQHGQQAGLTGAGGAGSLPPQVLWVQACVGSLHLESPSSSFATPLGNPRAWLSSSTSRTTSSPRGPSAIPNRGRCADGTDIPPHTGIVTADANIESVTESAVLR